MTLNQQDAIERLRHKYAAKVSSIFIIKDSGYEGCIGINAISEFGYEHQLAIEEDGEIRWIGGDLE